MIKKKLSPFCKGMLIYAAAYLLLVGIGLTVFWHYIAAYERSRPQTAVDQYIAQLDEAQLRAGCKDFLQTLDGNIQTEEEAFGHIQESLSGGITFIQDRKYNGDGTMQYLLRSGEQTVGRVTISQGKDGSFGFYNWAVTETAFDFTHLLGEPFSIMVPHDYCVSLNGNVLDESYTENADIPYEALAAFSGEFPMVHMVSYSADSFLGTPAVEVMTPEGTFARIDRETDYNRFIPRCTEEEQKMLDSAIETFLKRYVAFTGSANREVGGNFSRLRDCLVKNGELAARLRKAFDGLQYAQSYSDTITSITVHHYYKVSEERYVCDLTYVVDTVGQHGLITSQNNLKVVFLQTDSGPKVEALSSY